MTKQYQAIRGMNDIVPEQTPIWQWIETQLKSLAEDYGYREIRFPIVEELALFKRTIGEVTDIVEKEMYAFADRNGDWLALRPEGTAGCVRAGIEQGLLYNQQQKLWYIGPMFRHERPQKGRYRQFHQFGLEAFGYAGPDVDAELILLTARFWQALQLNNLQLQINSLGSSEARAAYRAELVKYYSKHHELLDEDSQRRLHTNPLRILDSKNPALQALNAQAPKLIDHLDEESRLHFQQLCQLLDSLGISYVVNPRLVRGLDYYNKTVFEWVTTELGAQGTVCAGGRYDGLVEQLGGKATPAIGMALGLERLVSLIEQQGNYPGAQAPALYIVMAGDAATAAGLTLAETIRAALPQIKVACNLGGGNFKNQLKRADKSGAEYALILGDDEVQQGTVVVKPLRQSESPQQILKQQQLIEFLRMGVHCE